jgi:LCP family protein required for cell wall assembly
MDINPRNSKANPSIPRRQNRSSIGDFKNARELKQTEISDGRTEGSQQNPEPFKLDLADIDEDKYTTAKAKWWHWFKPGHIRRNFSPRRFFKRAGMFGGVVVLAIGGFLAYRLYFASRNIIDRDSGGALALQGNIDPSQLNGEGDGRVNILLIGIGGDNHDGGQLADTIIVASIDPFNHEVAMLSVPRDLWVDIPGQWTTKINAAHALGEESNFREDGYPNGGPGLLQKTVEQTLDIPIHYYVRVDFDGFASAVDAVGSINIDVPEEVCDFTIAWQFNFSCIKAGRQEFNSNKALFYARTRASTRGDFDRGERQRLIIIALQEKVLSLDTFSNPFKISSLLETAGNHVKTNLQLGEMLRIYELGGEIGQDKIVSSGLDSYVTTANRGGASVVVPIATGFSEIQRYVRSIFIDGFIKKEAASIDLLNGSGVDSIATLKADELRSYGYTLAMIGNAPSSDYASTRLYDLSDGSAPFTKRYLEQRFSTVALSANQLPVGLNSDSKFVIIIGKDATR